MPRISSVVANAAVHRQPNRFLPVCFCLAVLLVGTFTQLANAVGVAAPRYAYVLDENADAIDMFSINLTTGVLGHLNCVGGPPNPLPLAPFGIGAPSSGRVDPTGSFLFITDVKLGFIAGFQILANGCLAFIPPLQPTVGLNPSHLDISSSGEFLYVSDTCGGVGCVEGFFIVPNGTLIPVAGGPSPAGANAGGLAVDPVREFVYASDVAGPGTINETRFNPGTGVLGAFAANPTAHPNPFRMALDPVGNGLVGPAATQFLFVLGNGGANLDCYTINTAGGALAFGGTAPTGLNPHSVAATSLGQFAYVTNFGGNSVQAYNINNCNGLAVDGAALPMGAGANPAGLAVDQTGRFVYVAASGIGQVWGYRVNTNTGTLVKIGAWATAAGPIHVATMP